jgi:hypothetical protein
MVDVAYKQLHGMVAAQARELGSNLPTDGQQSQGQTDKKTMEYHLPSTI